ncbi:unnamed protein product [Clavelina lepadiformis]|uniref:Transmembrane protein n=1 Tax=Clavelina lepadiformis TaxID=159417 RepID=A0ABP0FZ78_CLALP
MNVRVQSGNEDKTTRRAWVCLMLLWMVALGCMIAGAAIWVKGTAENRTSMQVLGNVVVAYLPLIFCAVGVCKCIYKSPPDDSIV